VGVRIRERVRRRLAHDHAFAAADVARHADVAGDEVGAHADPVAGQEALARADVGPPRRAGQGEGERAAGALLELLAREQALLDAQRRQARERAFVVARRQVVARLHALDRMAIFVHVEDAELHCQRVQRVRANFPGGMEDRRVGCMANRAEALLAAEVVHAVHVCPPRRAGPRRSSSRG
jgi:hypothetical protein